MHLRHLYICISNIWQLLFLSKWFWRCPTDLFHTWPRWQFYRWARSGPRTDRTDIDGGQPSCPASCLLDNTGRTCRNRSCVSGIRRHLQFSHLHRHLEKLYLHYFLVWLFFFYKRSPRNWAKENFLKEATYEYYLAKGNFHQFSMILKLKCRKYEKTYLRRIEDFPLLEDFWRVEPMWTQNRRTDPRQKRDLTSFLKRNFCKTEQMEIIRSETNVW